MAQDRIAAAHELPPALTGAIEVFIDRSDTAAAANLASYGLPHEEAERLSKLWSGYDLCGVVSNELTEGLRAAGIEAMPMVNDDAIAAEFTVHGSEGMDWRTVRYKRHVLVVADVQGTPYHIDANWQQFLGDVGQTETDIEANQPWVIVPEERVLCYTPDEVGEVSEWFGLVARSVQNRHKIHNQADPDPMIAAPLNTMYTRQMGIEDLMTGNSHQLPADYYPVDYLEQMARQIWDPSHYRPVTGEDYPVSATPPTVL